MTNLYKYRIFCVTEQAFVYTWSDVTPTVCPNNNTHTIDPSTITIIESQLINTVVPIDDNTGVQGYYGSQGFNINISAGPSPNQILANQLVFKPYDVRIYSITLLPSAANIGDTVTMKAPMDILIGVITSSVNSGNVINVNSTVLQNVAIGLHISLSDGTNEQDLGEIYAIDTTAQTLTMQNPVSISFNSATPTNVLLSLCRVQNVTFGSDSPLTFGSTKYGSVLMPGGTNGGILYQNNTNATKTFSFLVEYTF